MKHFRQINSASLKILNRTNVIKAFLNKKRATKLTIFVFNNTYFTMYFIKQDKYKLFRVVHIELVDQCVLESVIIKYVLLKKYTIY